MDLLHNITTELEQAFRTEIANANHRVKSLKTEDDIVSVWADQSFKNLYSARNLDGASTSLTLLEMFLRIRNQLASLLMAVPEKYNFNDDSLIHLRSKRGTLAMLPYFVQAGSNAQSELMDDEFSDLDFDQEFNFDDHRDKREILGSVAIGMSLWNSYKIHNLENHLANLSSKYNVLVDSTNLLSAKHNQLAADVVLMKRLIEIISSTNYRKILAVSLSAADRLRDTVDSVVSIVTSGRQRRISPRLLNGDALAEAYISLLQKAKELNSELLLLHPTDIYNVQASYGYSQQGLVFEVVAHVPMAEKTEKLALLEHIPFPIAYQSRMSNSTITPDVGNDKYLAVLPLTQASSTAVSHRFRVLNEAELQSCFMLRNYYLCSGRNSLRTDIKSSCISSLWLKDFELIQKNCNMKIEPPQEVVAKISPREWLIYSPVSMSKSIACGKNVIDSLRFERQTLLTLVEDCELNLERHYLSTDVNILIDFRIQTHDWKYYGSVFAAVEDTRDNFDEVIEEVAASKGKFGLQDLSFLKHYFVA